MHTDGRYLSMIQVQRELGVSAAYVEELIASGRLPAFRILGQWRIDRELLEQMVDALYEESADDPDPGIGDVAGNEATAPAGGTGMTAAGGAERVLPGRSALLPAALTGQQRRILRLVGQGMSNAEIAANLSLEISTVKSHVSRLLQRCGLRDREQLIVLAWRSGLMSDDHSNDPPVPKG
ncbi:MAG TPA: LuxR C-terminal-related transcriptional regulator [Kribbellaceae bacterium]|nr:LuxR C-terminal-related transcriptional regulator [Kribbellaceae bacterium]